MAIGPALVERLEQTLINVDTPVLRRAVWIPNYQTLLEGGREEKTAYVSLFNFALAQAGKVRGGTNFQQTWIVALAQQNLYDTQNNTAVNSDIGRLMVAVHAQVAFWKPTAVGFREFGMQPESPPALLDPLPGYGIYPLTYTIPMTLSNPQTNRPSMLRPTE